MGAGLFRRPATPLPGMPGLQQPGFQARYIRIRPLALGWAISSIIDIFLYSNIKVGPWYRGYRFTRVERLLQHMCGTKNGYDQLGGGQHKESVPVARKSTNSDYITKARELGNHAVCW